MNEISIWARRLAGGVLMAVGLAIAVLLTFALYTKEAWSERTFIDLGIPATMLTPLVAAAFVGIGLWLAAPRLFRRRKSPDRI